MKIFRFFFLPFTGDLKQKVIIICKFGFTNILTNFFLEMYDKFFVDKNLNHIDSKI